MILNTWQQDISVDKAKKAISGYKKAIGLPEGLAELTLFYCESFMNLLGDFDMDDESRMRRLSQAIRMPLSSGLNVSGAKATTGLGRWR